MGKWINIDDLPSGRVEWDDILDAPSIDIVFCKECKYCVDAGAQRALVCDNSYIDMDIHPDDYCSYGERKESE